MATEGSWIPQGISATLTDLVGLYSQVETVKLSNQLARAKASADGFNQPTTTKNPQATAGVSVSKPPVNPWLIGAGVGGAVLLVYLLVK